MSVYGHICENSLRSCVSLEDYQLLEMVLLHSDASVRARTCSLLGNMLRNSDEFGAVLNDRCVIFCNHLFGSFFFFMLIICDLILIVLYCI